MFCCIKKSKGGICLGLGIGILSVLIIPLEIWLFLVGITLVLMGLKTIFSKKHRR